MRNTLRTTISFLIALLAAVPASVVRAVDMLPLRLVYDRPAAEWMTEALPIGNGDMGAMFFGGIGREHLQFNEKTLWSGSTTVRGSYRNFGDIYVGIAQPRDAVTDYSRTLSLDDALGSVAYTCGGMRHERRYFASHADSVVVARFATPSKRGALTLVVSMKDGDGRAAAASDGCLSFGGRLDLVSYEARLAVVAEGGSMSTTDTAVVVRDADAVTLVLAAATNYDMQSPTYVGIDASQLRRVVAGRVSRACSLGYDALLSRHLDDYRQLFGRVDLTLADSVPTCTTDQLLRQRKYNNYLDMLCFQYGRYLMISSSRGGTVPSNLQGLWNNVNNPAWECDYHSNINVQMNYWPAEPTALAECHEPFIGYVSTEAMRPGGSWRRVAAGEGCRGWTLHTQNNLFGYTDWNINRPANAWYATHLWQHYLYGLDADYLQRVAWPVMSDACRYWFDRLRLRDGRLVAPDDWSPEHGPWEDGPAYAQQLVVELMRNTLEAAHVLGREDALADSLRRCIATLDNGLHVGSRGQLREWLVSDDTPGDRHRHLSHLMALYPFNTISWMRDSTIAAAARVSLDERGDGATGWSRAWKVACRARLGDGERAYLLLKAAQNATNVTYVSMDDDAGGMYDNLLCAHPSFQIDGNFGICAAVAEMLVQNTDRGVWLLPALPRAWSKGRFDGLRAHGGLTVGAQWSDCRLQRCTVETAVDRRCHLYLPGGAPRRIVDNRGRRVRHRVDDNSVVSFDVRRGRTYTLLF